MRRRPDPECQRHERWHESRGLAYRREYAASCPLSSFPRRSPADRSKPPFFSAFHALAIDNGGGGTGPPANPFSAFYIKVPLAEMERAILTPTVEQIEQRAQSEKAFRCAPRMRTGGRSV